MLRSILLGSVVGLIFTVVASYTFGIFGALIALVTYQSLVFIVTLSLISRSSRFTWKMFFGKFSKAAALRLSNFSKMAIVSLIVLPLAQMIVRTYLIDHKGINEAGFVGKYEQDFKHLSDRDHHFTQRLLLTQT